MLNFCPFWTRLFHRKGWLLLEEHCKSACTQNSVSSIPTGLLEGMDGKNKLPISDAVKQINDNYGCLTEERKRMHLDHRTVDRAEFIQKVCESLLLF